MGNPPLEVVPGQRKTDVNSYRLQTVHRGKVDPGVSELPRGNELSRDHVNRPLDTALPLTEEKNDKDMLYAFSCIYHGSSGTCVFYF